MPVAPCALYGTHRMKSPRNVAVRDENGNIINKEFTLVSLYTCGCGDRFLSSGTPHTGDYIRYYATEGAITKVVNSPLGQHYYVKKNLVYLRDKNTLEGYSFSL